jgi:NAD-dependent SIR2 family protein deacetylase
MNIGDKCGHLKIMAIEGKSLKCSCELCGQTVKRTKQFWYQAVARLSQSSCKACMKKRKPSMSVGWLSVRGALTEFGIKEDEK